MVLCTLDFHSRGCRFESGRGDHKLSFYKALQYKKFFKKVVDIKSKMHYLNDTIRRNARRSNSCLEDVSKAKKQVDINYTEC
jgi:hypothetical protein